MIDLALATVKRRSPKRRRSSSCAALEAVVNADRRVSLHEFVVLTLVRASSAPAQAGRDEGSRTCKTQAATLLALVAHAGTRSDATGEREADLAAAIHPGASAWHSGHCFAGAAQPDAVNEALEALRSLAPMEKACW